MHELYCLKCKAKIWLPRQHIVYSKACDVRAVQDQPTQPFMTHMQVMALNLKPSYDRKLLDVAIKDLKINQLKQAQKVVCKGQRVLWLHCNLEGKRFYDCIPFAGGHENTLQQVINKCMFMEAVKVMESKCTFEHWEFQIIVKNTMKAAVPFISQEKLLDTTCPGRGGCAKFLVHTGSHPCIVSHVIEVQVAEQMYASNIKKIVKKLIEKM